MTNGNTSNKAISHTTGVLFVLLSALFFSLGGLLIKSSTWSALSVSAGRSFFAAITLFVYLKVCGRQFRVNKAVLLGALFNYGMLQTFVMATKLTTAANAIVLQFAEPVWVIFLVWLLFHERPRKESVFTCVVVIVGIACSFADQLSADGILGSSLAVISGVFYAGVFLIKKIPGSDFECSAIISFAACTITGIPSLIAEPTFDIANVGIAAIQGLVQCGAAYIFLSKGLDVVSPVTASLTSVIEPVLNPIWVALVLGETIGPMAIIGLILVLGATTVYNVYVARKSTSE